MIRRALMTLALMAVPSAVLAQGTIEGTIDRDSATPGSR